MQRFSAILSPWMDDEDLNKGTSGNLCLRSHGDTPRLGPYDSTADFCTLLKSYGSSTDFV